MIEARTGRAGKTDKKREDILDASERIFAEKGFHETGIADIAAELGMGHGTFYRYFKNKHDIAIKVIDRLVARFGEIGLAEDPNASGTLEEYRAQSARIIERWLEFTDQHPHVMRFFHEQSAIVDGRRMQLVIEMYVVQMARFLENGIAKGFLLATLDVRPTAELVVGMILDFTRRAASLPDADARRRRAEAGLALMFDGIRAR
jgi:AcrR family transcriptional regulator